MDSTVEALQTISTQQWMITIIGGIVFAACFNIPARSKYLSRESDTRKMAVRYDALNFIVFFFTFPLAQGLVALQNHGDITRLVVVSVTFWLYSLAFWLVLWTYMKLKSKRND